MEHVKTTKYFYYIEGGQRRSSVISILGYNQNLTGQVPGLFVLSDSLSRGVGLDDLKTSPPI